MTLTTTQRGYGWPHRAERERWRPTVDRGDAYCQEPICIQEDRWIEPGTPWHLAHDHLTGKYLGPAHERCNISERNRRHPTYNSGFLDTDARDQPSRAPVTTVQSVRFSGIGLRPELLWPAHLESAPKWLGPFLDVPADAAPPLVMTPVHPRAVGSYGGVACDWLEETAATPPLRWWQRLAMVRQLEHDADGRLCWSGMVESASRRVGKSVRLQGGALWRLANADLFGETQLAIHTGKDLPIVREIQRRAWRWCETHGWRVLKAIGRETIENGEHRWLARSTDAIYGYDVTLGYVDEAWAVDSEAVTDGLEPATLERLSPQIVLTATAHRRATGLMRTRIRDALLVDDGETLLMLWSVPDGMDMGLQSTWRAASAHWSEDRARLLASKYAKASSGQQDPEFDDPDPMAGFASQYLNRWPLGQVRPDTVIDPELWTACAISAERVGEAWFGVEVENGLAAASVASGGEAEGGRRWMRVERRPGIDWVPDVLTKLGAPHVAMDTAGAAAALIRPLEEAGVWVVPMGTRDVIQACGELQSDVLSLRAVNPEQPDLDDAVRAAQKRDIGDQGGWVFGRKKSGKPISALQACAWALWLWRNNEDPTIWRRRA